MTLLSDGCLAVPSDELRASLLPGISQTEIDKAVADIDEAERRGFMHCMAVFNRANEYDGLWERAHPWDESLNWGRGQELTKRSFFRDGKVVPDPDWKAPPPASAFQHMGFKCEVRTNRMGYNCGYVSIPSGHPWHGKGYDHIEADIHGGLTFGEMEDDGSYTVGFDCAHYGDAPDPAYIKERVRKYGSEYGRLAHLEDGVHWTIPMVAAETRRLAEQAASAHMSLLTQRVG